MFSNALNYYNEGQYRSALKLFKKIETRYSFSDLAPGQLMITYIYYQMQIILVLKFKKISNFASKNENIVI